MRGYRCGALATCPMYLSLSACILDVRSCSATPPSLLVWMRVLCCMLGSVFLKMKDLSFFCILRIKLGGGSQTVDM